MERKTKKQADIERAIGQIDQRLDSVSSKIMAKIDNNESITLSEIQILREIKMELKKDEAESRVVSTQKELSKHIGKSLRSISYYKNQGMPVNDNGTYDLDAILTWLKDRKEGKRHPKKKGIITRIKERVLPGNKGGYRFALPSIQERSIKKRRCI